MKPKYRPDRFDRDDNNNSHYCSITGFMLGTVGLLGLPTYFDVEPSELGVDYTHDVYSTHWSMTDTFARTYRIHTK